MYHTRYSTHRYNGLTYSINTDLHVSNSSTWQYTTFSVLEFTRKTYIASYEYYSANISLLN